MRRLGRPECSLQPSIGKIDLPHFKRSVQVTYYSIRNVVDRARIA